MFKKFKDIQVLTKILFNLVFEFRIKKIHVLIINPKLEIPVRSNYKTSFIQKKFLKRISYLESLQI